MKTLLLFFIAFFTFQSSIFSQDWPMTGGDRERTSFKQVNLTFPLDTAIIYDLGTGGNEDGMCIYDGFIYVQDSRDSNVLIAFDLETGDSLWHFEVPNSAASANFIPAAAGNVVLAGGQSGLGLYGLNRYNGSQLWFKDVGSLYTQSPMVDDTLVFLGKDSLYCLNINTGNTIWARKGVTSQVVPCLDSSLLFYAHGSIIYAVDKWTGQELWTNDAIPTSSFTTLAVDDERLYIGNRTFVTALDKTNGMVIWNISAPDINSIQDWPSGFCVTDQHIFIKDFLPGPPEVNGFVVVNKETGVVENSWSVDYMNYSSPTVTGQHFIDGQSGTVYFYNYQTGALDYSLNTSNNITQPLVANGMIYIGSYGNVMALKPKITSTEENEISFSRNIYPNPGQAICLMETGEETSEGILEIIDITGKILITHQAIPKAGHVEFDVRRLNPGMYIVKFTTDDRIQTGTLMKK